jgi:hypothetical protein
MKMHYLFSLFLILTYGIAFSAPRTIAPSDTLIEYSGRIDFTNVNAPRFSYSGVSIRTCFKGTSVSVILNDERGENYYNIILDKTEISRIQPQTGQQTYQLAENLDDTLHQIEIFRLTEEMFGKTSFLGFVMDEADSLVAINDIREPLIEYIGNSITCGYGNEGVNGGTFGASTENHYMTYAAITSRSFNARHLAVCKSGIGIYRNYDGPAEGSPDCMPNFYNRIYLYNAVPKYSFAETPDLVCINLGTNDFSTIGGDSALYVGKYLNFIDSIQNHYSQPDIICLVGSMLGGDNLERVRRYVQFVADSANNRGKGNVYFFEMSEQTGDLGIAIDYHPTIAQHMKNSRELIQFISELKEWPVHPVILKAEAVASTIIKLKFNSGIYISGKTSGGFSVKADGVNIEIDSVYVDPVDSFTLQLKLSNTISIGQVIDLGYQGNQIRSGSISLVPFNIFHVENKLTPTVINSGKINSNGLSISLVFNKRMQLPESVSGISMESTTGPVEIDSFSVSTATIKLFSIDEIVKSDTVTVSYSGIELAGEDGIPAENFENLILDNQSVITIINDLKPVKNIFDFYPNPAYEGVIHYIARPERANAKILLSILDMTGNTLLQKNLTSHEGDIDLSQILIHNSIYILSLKIDDHELTYKLLF